SNTELYSPLVDETWTVTIQTGTVDVNVAPDGTAITGPITGDGPSGKVAKIQTPASGLISTITVTAPGANPFPYDILESHGDKPYWSISAITVDTTAAYSAVNVFTVVLTAQDLGVGGTPIGVEHVYGTPLPLKGTLNFGKLDGPYGSVGDP